MLKRNDDDERNDFERLKRLLIEYDNDTMNFIPAELVKICRERRIELSLCKEAKG